MIPQAQQLSKVLDLVFVVAVGEADLLEAARGEAGADRRAIAEILGVMNHADARIVPREGVGDHARPVGRCVVDDDDLVLRADQLRNRTAFAIMSAMVASSR